MKKGLMLLAEGFETSEAIVTLDALRRTHEAIVDYVSIGDSVEVVSSQGLVFQASGLLKDVASNEYDFLILPGGKLGVENLASNQRVIDLIKQFHKEGKYLCAICAAPSILGELGYLDGRKYTCFPGFQRGNGEYLDIGAVADLKIITGHSMGYTLAFAETIIGTIIGEEALRRIQPGVRGL